MTPLLLSLALIASAAFVPATSRAEGAQSYRVVRDAIPEPLAAPGDTARGRALLLAREPANCILCHAAPAELVAAGARFSGNLAPSLDGVGARLSEAQLRLRIADGRRLNPQTIMPSYYRTEGLVEVGVAWRGRPILAAQQLEDLLAYLSTLR
jgi:sulfur-oxidizing protein SoxX